MTDIPTLALHLHRLLPIERLLQDLHADLEMNEDDPVPVTVETGVIYVPKGVGAEEITKVMQYDVFEGYVGFRAVLAVGGIERYGNGVFTPGICFAKLYYNENAQCASVDYYVGFGR